MKSSEFERESYNPEIQNLGIKNIYVLSAYLEQTPMLISAFVLHWDFAHCICANT